MFKTIRRALGNVPVGLMSKDHSVGTGLLLGLAVWTLTRLVDGITQSGTIEYRTIYKSVSVADGRPPSEVSVLLRNFSRDVSVRDLEVSIEDPHNKIVFDNTEPGLCAFGAPAWAKDAYCRPDPKGMAFRAPMLIPDTFVQVGIRYTGPLTGPNRPIVRIKASGDSKFRLIEPGWQTWTAAHENTVLFTLLGATFVLLFFSIAASGARSTSPTSKSGSTTT